MMYIGMTRSWTLYHFTYDCYHISMNMKCLFSCWMMNYYISFIKMMSKRKLNLCCSMSNLINSLTSLLKNGNF